ncbi:hypothetical protein Asi03nite_68970 [Actinoplanes siamensis]|uniref:Carrier domain-containing protein n=1 Tax=Actinoplanes siamensis TaxID=1223317 RepID=A0A919NER2_9ACTN|nr:hypothetical protein Asi03nite_68970 [Actinoplanes siamensis]
MPLSSAQHRLWFLHRLDPDSPAYNLDYLWRVDGELDVTAFSRAVDGVVRRHAVLRTNFRDEDGEPYQVVGETGPELVVDDWSDRSLADAETEALALLDREVLLPYDLGKDPLVRLRLLRLGPDRHLFLILFHHIVVDGWSMDVFWRELGSLYAAFRTGAAEPPVPSAMHYADYATAQAAWLATPDADEQRQFWKRALSGAPATLDLPTDAPRPPVPSGRGNRLDFIVPAEVTARLRDIGRRYNASLFMVTQTAFDVLLSYYTGRTDIVTGSPIAGRTRPEIENMMGLCANEIPLRLRWTGDPSFGALLGRLRDVALDAYGHQDLPFDQMVRSLVTHRDLSRNPIFQVLFQGGREDQTPEMPGLRLQQVRGEANTLGFDMEMRLQTDGAELAGSVRYSTDLFAEWSMRSFVENFAQLLAVISENPERMLSDLRPRSAIGAHETVVGQPAVPRLLARIAEQQGTDPAVLDDWTRIGFEELQTRVERVAAGLSARHAGPGRTVAVALPFGSDQLIAVLAALNTGADCLVAEPDEHGAFESPAERTAIDLVISSELCREDLAEAGWTTVPVLIDDLRTATPTALPAPGRTGDLLVAVAGRWVALNPSALSTAVHAGTSGCRLVRALGELAAGRSVDVTRSEQPAVAAPLADLGPVATWLTVDAADRVQPVPGVDAVVLGPDLRPVPVGMPGDLYLAGAGAAYPGQPGETAVTWVAAPVGPPGNRMVGTGLRARWRPDRTVDVLPRVGGDGPRVVSGLQTALSELDEVAWATAIQFLGDEQPIAYVVLRTDEVTEPDREQAVQQWGDVFDATYRGAERAAPEADFAGWRSSYSGERIAEAEMREWRDGIVDVILAQRPGRVLEIGVGTGLLLSRVASAADTYWGTDVSGAAVERLRAELGDTGDRIQLRHQAAHDISGLPPGHFDTVVINSVVQYFPDTDYLVGVLDSVRTLVAPHGRLILGDLRNLHLLRHFHAELKPAGVTGAELDLAVAQEEELLVEPGFLAGYLADRPDEVAVDVRIKRARHLNEMSRYRFDVVLHFAPERVYPVAAAPEISWGTDVESVAEIGALIAGDRPACLRVTGIPNERIRQAADRLREAGEDGLPPGPELSALLALGDDGTGYEAVPTWCADDPERIDLVLVDRDQLGDATLDGTYRGMPGGPGTNQPYVRPSTSGILVTIRKRLAERLSAGRLPAEIVLLHRPPYTADGILDFTALPRPEPADADNGPRDHWEHTVRDVFAEVLGRTRVERHENFFEIGGHSLLAVRLMSRIRATLGVELSMEALFRAPTVAKLTALARAAAPATARAVVPRAADRENVPLSPAQRGVWLVQQMEGPSPAYNMPLALYLDGDLDVAALHAALGDLVRRHEALRTRFRETADDPLTDIVPADQVALVMPLARVDEHDLTQTLTEAARHVFDLTAEIPVHATLFTTGPRAHVLLLNIHHVAADGRSLQLIGRDLGTAYAARQAGHEPGWPPAALQYADYVLWHRERLGAEDDPESLFSRQLAHWQNVLAELPAELPLPVDRPRPARPTHQGASFYTSLDRSTHAEIIRFAASADATVFMVVQAALAALLFRLGAGDDIPISTAVDGRSEPELEDVVGFFVNTLVLRTDVSGDPSYRELVDRVRRTDMLALAHQDLPFGRLVQWLNPIRDVRRSPLAQVGLNFESNALGQIDLPGLTVRVDDKTDLGRSKMDLTFYLRESRTPDGRPTGITIGVDYATDLFDAVSIERLAAQLVQTLQSGLAQPDRPVGDLEVLDARTRRKLLADGNDSPSLVPPVVFPVLFEAQARRSPHAIALESATGDMSYAELNERANRLARCLVGAGLGAEDVIAVALPRSVDFVVAILGIMKAGAAYLPVDPDYPADRVRFMLSDSGAARLLTTAEAAARLPKAGPARLQLVGGGESVVFHDGTGAARAVSLAGFAAGDLDDADRRAPLLPDHLAYAIYTSGSTGRPSRVAVTHAGIAGLAATQIPGYGSGPGARLLQFASPSFDAAFSELSTALLSGATVVLADPDEMVPGPTLTDLLRRRRVSHVMLPPSALAVMEPEQVSADTTIVAAGEALPGATARRWSARLRLVNAYGPTESTVCATISREPFPDDGPPTIGRPLVNISAYVLDARLGLVPPGVVGELYLSGPGLARGYGDQPRLTAQRFVANPFRTDGSRMYRTGDLARRDNHGNLYFAGRADHQVKVRGYRIELGEIERLLSRDSTVAQAVAVATGADLTGTDDQLVAYVVPVSGAAPNLEVMRRRLAETLPPYAVPAQIVLLDSFPLTPNGKVDRSALVRPSETAADAGDRAATPAEELLRGLFAEVLGLERIGVHDDFFAAGGHSLRAVRLISKVRQVFHSEISVRELFEAPTPARLARRLETAGPERPPVVAGRRPESLPLSYAQLRLWFLDQFEGSATTYNMPVAYRLTGQLDRAALTTALNDVVARHESLRTVFRTVDGRPVQVVLPPGPVPLELREVTERNLAAATEEAVGHRFDLSAEIPLRVSLFRISPWEHVLVLLFHHIAGDGESVRRFHDDLNIAYRARRHGRAPDWAPLPVQYADYALWQRNLLGDAGDPDSLLAQQLAFWRSALDGAPAELSYPTDRLRPVVATYRGAAVHQDLPDELHRALLRVARATGTTMSMVMHAALAALLSRLGAGTDLPIGTPTAGRLDEGLDPLIGFFVNTLVLRIDVAGDPSFTELLGRVRETSLAAYGNQDVPFERIVEELNPPRTLNRQPLFQVLMQVLIGSDAEAALDLPDVATADLPVTHQMEKFDLSFAVHVRMTDEGEPGPLRVWARYALDLFEDSTVRTMLDRLAALLTSVAADPHAPVSTLEIFTEGERDRLRTDWNDTAAPIARPGTVVQLFEEQVEMRPDATALVCPDAVRLTYRELDDRSNRLAHDLIARGIGPESVVGFCLPRGAETVTAILAVWKAGAAYVPIDPAYPADRITFILQDSRAAALIRSHDLAADLAVIGMEEIVLDADVTVVPPGGGPGRPAVRVAPANLAYIIYTSGSTGRPKGVAVTHASVANYVAFVPDRMALGRAGGRYALLQAQYTDLGNTILFSSLATGGELHVLPADEVTDPAAVAAYLATHDIDYLKAVPSHLVALTGPDMRVVLPNRSVVLGGEAVPSAWLADLLAVAGDRTVYNHYGPTEATIGCVTEHLTDDLIRDGVVPLGTPAPNTRIYILDEWLRPVPTGVVGELYVAGDGLARGYMSRPGMTAERFVACPFETSRRMYRTGDCAHWRGDGRIVFDGRVDDQVKVRGFRIEPGEVQAALVSHPAVAQAAVVVREGGTGARLVGYAVPAQPDLSAEAIRDHLSRTLPQHMIPAAVVLLDALPLTSNGKLNRRLLPEPEIAVSGGRAPANDRERLLCEMFAEVLGLPVVGPDDNFFALGGHSLLAVELISRVRSEFGGEMPVRTVFEAPTAVLMAASLRRNQPDGAMAPMLALRASGTLPPLFCVHPAIGLSWCYTGLLRYLDPDQPVYGLQARGFTDPGGPRSFDEMADDYLAEIRAVQPHGPYSLLGWSFGGLMAHALAVRLREVGEDVEFVGILDGFPSVSGVDRYELAYDDPDVRPAIAASIGRDPADPRSLLAELSPDAGDRLNRVFVDLHNLRGTFTSGIFDGSVVQFVASRDHENRGENDLWRRYVTGAVEVHEIDSTHGGMTDPVPMAVIGPIVAGHLARRSSRRKAT